MQVADPATLAEFDSRVAAFRRASAQKSEAAWSIGDWLVEMVPKENGGRGKTLSSSSGFSWDDLTARSGLGYRWLTELRQAAEHFPPGHRADAIGPAVHIEAFKATGSAIAALAALSTKPRLRDWQHLDVPAATRALADPTQRERILNELPPEHRVEVLKNVAEDAVGNMFDPAVSPALAVVADVSLRQTEVQEKRTKRILATDRVSQKIDGMRALLDLGEVMDRAQTEIRRLLPLCVPPGQGVMADELFLRHSLAALREMLDATERFIDTGKTDVDAFVSDVLGGK